MKKLTKILFLLLLPFFTRSQSQKRELDSLHLALRNTANDTARMIILKNIVGYYVERNRDSTMYYAENGIAIAKRINQPLWVADFLLLKSYLNQKHANLVLSLKFCNQALAIANDIRYERNVFIPKDEEFAADPSKFRRGITLSGFHQLGNIYSIGGNKEKAIDYFKKEIQGSYELNTKNFRVTSNMTIGSIYLEMDKPDSALVYSKRALENVGLSKWKIYEGFILRDIGTIYFKRGLPDSAEYYFQRAIAVNRDQYNVAGEIGSYNSLADLHEKKKQPDSMLYYASAALLLARQLKSAEEKKISNGQVARAWEMLGNADSALSYLNLSKTVGDSLQKSLNERLIQFQNQNFEDLIQLEKESQENVAAKNKIRITALFGVLALLSVLAFVFYRNNLQKQKANQILETTLTNLKSTQAQLIQSEKMASLGELTAGIAHEIQNPLNFVNNFSDLNKEMLVELTEEIEQRNYDDVKAIAKDVIANEEKINHHGKRADAIVKGMLQHSRNSSGQREPTDLNALIEEYLRLSFHGIMARDKSFNSAFEFIPDPALPKLNVVPQDIGRVLLNLINNAFQAVNGFGDKPKVTVTTLKKDHIIEIRVADNGPGIPEAIRDKIFQPFFTTKPTGQGTGLGLSLSYDIVKAHGGEIKINNSPGEGVEFVVSLPAN